MIKTANQIFALALFLWASAAYSRDETPDYSDDSRYEIVVGEVVSYEETGRYSDGLVTQHELEVSIQYELKNRNSDRKKNTVTISYWVHNPKDNSDLISKKIILIFNRNDNHSLENYVFSTSVFCVGEVEYIKNGWEDLGVSSIGDGCFEYFNN